MKNQLSKLLEAALGKGGRTTALLGLAATLFLGGPSTSPSASDESSDDPAFIRVDDASGEPGATVAIPPAAETSVEKISQGFALLTEGVTGLLGLNFQELLFTLLALWLMAVRGVEMPKKPKPAPAAPPSE
ncbi:MAG: hypothetical protein AAGJ81_14760 [Verrucomicrobiota bacterium]